MEYGANNSLPAGSRVVAYLRDSGGPGQDLSVEQQEVKLSEFCKQQGYLLTRMYKDVARSGGSTRKRKQFLLMVDYLTDNDRPAAEQGVIIWSYSRFSRDYDDLLYYVSQLRLHHRVLISITDPVPNTLDGRLIEAVTAYKNAAVRQDIARDTRRGKEHSVVINHSWTGGRNPPYGYKTLREVIGKYKDGRDMTRSRLVVDPGKAPFVRRAYEMRAKGATLAEIAAATGINVQVVQYIVKNRVYLGELVYAEREIVENYCEPIVTRELWEAVQRINEERGGSVKRAHPRRVASAYLLSGLLHCSRCGRVMNGVSVQSPINGERWYYYRCMKESGWPYIPRDQIEGEVIRICQARILTPEVMGVLAGQVEEQRARKREGVDVETEAMKAELGNLKRQADNILAAIRATGHSPAMIAELQEIEAEQQRIEAEVTRMQTAPGIQPIDYDVETVAHALADALASTDRMTQKRALAQFIHSITVEMDGKQIRGEVVIFLPGMPDVTMAVGEMGKAHLMNIPSLTDV